MAAGLRVADALDASTLHGPGPVLVLQAYSPEVLAALADALPARADVTVLRHLGLVDQSVTTTSLAGLASVDADHLTSLWVQGWPGGAAAVESLAALARRLRAECPWDAEQSHGSLTRHLLEEAYEAIDALDALGREGDGGPDQGVRRPRGRGARRPPLPRRLPRRARGRGRALRPRRGRAARDGQARVAPPPRLRRRRGAHRARGRGALGGPQARGEGTRVGPRRGRLRPAGARPLHQAPLPSRPRRATASARSGARRVDDATGLVGALVDLCARALDAGVDLEGELRERALSPRRRAARGRAGRGRAARAVALPRRRPMSAIEFVRGRRSWTRGATRRSRPRSSSSPGPRAGRSPRRGRRPGRARPWSCATAATPTRRQGRDPRGRLGQRRDRRGARRASTASTSARVDLAMVDLDGDARPRATRRQRHPGGVARDRQGRRGRDRAAALPLPRRGQRPRAARADA